MSNFHPLEVVNRGSETQLVIHVIPYLTFRKKRRHQPNAGTMLVQRVRRCTSIDPTLDRCMDGRINK